MKITVDAKVYDYDPDRLMLTEAKVIQQHTGMTVPKWQHKLAEMDVDCLQALVWLLRFRDGERDLRPADVDFDLGTLDLETVEGDASDPSGEAVPNRQT